MDASINFRQTYVCELWMCSNKRCAKIHDGRIKTIRIFQYFRFFFFFCKIEGSGRILLTKFINYDGVVDVLIIVLPCFAFITVYYRFMSSLR